MIRYVLKRIITLIPVLLVVLFIVYSIMSFTPGDPARMMLGVSATAERVDALREQMGLNDPFIVQFFRYVWNVITKFDFGDSYQTKQAVTGEIMARFPTTVKLTVFSILFAAILALPMGVYSAIKQYSPMDYVVRFISTVLIAVPSVWLGLVFMIFFSNKLGWLPSGGLNSPVGYILPTITLGAYSVALYMRITRSSMLEVIREDYIRTARGKGIGRMKTIMRHTLKNGLLPVITIIGLDIGYCLGGAVIIENVFAIPGLGRYMVDGIRTKDTPVVLGSVMVLAITFCIANLVVDILYALMDPRIEVEYREQAARKRRVRNIRSTISKPSGNNNENA